MLSLVQVRAGCYFSGDYGLNSDAYNAVGRFTTSNKYRQACPNAPISQSLTGYHDNKGYLLQWDIKYATSTTTCTGVDGGVMTSAVATLVRTCTENGNLNRGGIFTINSQAVVTIDPNRCKFCPTESDTTSNTTSNATSPSSATKAQNSTG